LPFFKIKGTALLCEQQAFLFLYTLKPRVLHIVSSAFLIGALAFAQVAVNFFHNNHDAHQVKSITEPLKGGTSGLQKHGEHCKVCAIDFFNNAFITSSFQIFDHPVLLIHEAQFSFSIARIIISYSQGRAPPTSV
jgi:hypothetical protein